MHVKQQHLIAALAVAAIVIAIASAHTQATRQRTAADEPEPTAPDDLDALE